MENFTNILLSIISASLGVNWYFVSKLISKVDNNNDQINQIQKDIAVINTSITYLKESIRR